MTETYKQQAKRLQKRTRRAKIIKASGMGKDAQKIQHHDNQARRIK